MNFILANIAAVIPLSQNTKDIVIVAINAGATVTTVIALLGGGGLIAYIVKKAFQKGTTKLIVAA